MFRKQVNPRTAALAIVVILAVVQLAYWRLLVYVPPGRPPGPMGPGGGGAMQPFLNGLEQVEVETLAGGEPGYQDGPGWKARFCGPNALAFDGDGLLVADSRNHRIRRVSFSGKVSTVAGSDSTDGSGGRATGPALQARFRFPSGIAALRDGGVAIADTGNHRLCVLKNGTVTELAGGTPGQADGLGARARFQSPAALIEGSDGALWVLDAEGLRVRRVDRQGQVTSPAQVPAPVAAALGETVVGRQAEKIGGWEQAWEQPSPSEFEVGYRGAAWTPAGALRVFPDARQGVVLAQLPGSLPLLVAGRLTTSPPVGRSSDGDGSRATFAGPCAAATAPDGTVYVADYEGHAIRKLTLPDWLRSGQFTAPEPRGRWRGRRGN